MKPEVQNIPLKTADDFVTNIDTVDQKSNFYREVRGIRNLGSSFIAQRDFGTIHRIAAASYPACVVAGIATIHRVHTLHDLLTGLDYEILVCIDTTNNRVRIFVDTSGNDSGTWLELTRTFTAKVNGAPAVTTKVVNIDTITENGATLVPSAEDLIGYIVYNSTTDRLNSAYLTDNTATSITVDNYLGSDGLDWHDDDDLVFFRTAGHFKAYLENALAFTTTLLKAPPHFEFNPVENQRKVNVYYGDLGSNMRNPVQIMFRPDRVFFGASGGGYLQTILQRWDMEALGGGLIPSYVEVGSIDDLLIAGDGAITKDIVDQINGDVIAQITTQVTEYGTPSTDFNEVNIYATLVYADYEESDPFIKIFSKVFVTDSTSYLSVIPKINFSKLCKEVTAIRFYGMHATKSEVETYADKTKDDPVNYKLFREIRIGNASTLIAGTTTYSVGEIEPAFYTPPGSSGGYQVGDILTLVGGSGDATVRVDAVHTGGAGDQWTIIHLLNSGTSGYTVQTYNCTGGSGGGGAYVMVKTVIAHNTTPTDIWSLVPTSQFPFQMSEVQITHGIIDGFAINYGNKSILDTLQHAISTERVINRPKFGITTTRSENPISVIYVDDRTLEYSTIDGYGVVEDDNFTNVGVDQTGTLLRANLSGNLPIKAIASWNSQVHVFRQQMREIIDPQSGSQSSRKCDFYANRSVISSPLGLAWCGYSGIYFIPIGDFAEVPINLRWQNLYDGTLKITDGSAPFITDDYRSAIIGGWDATFREFWWHCQVNKADGSGSEYLCFRYSPDYKRWTIRQLNIGASYSPLVAFSQKSDGTMSLIYATGILKYPNRTGTYQYTDDVPYGGATTGKGIPTSFKLIVGEIADKFAQNLLTQILPDYKGSSISGLGRLQINLYANKESTVFDTQYFPVDVKEDEVRLIEERDNLSELAVEVTIPSADLVDVKDLDISTIYLGLIKKLRSGNL